MDKWNQEYLEQQIYELTDALDEHPQKANVYVTRGNLYCNLHQWDKAVSDYRSALSVDPDNYHAHSNMGYVHFQIGDYESAVDRFSDAIRVRPTADILIKRATSYSRMNRGQEALNDILQAMRMDTSDPEVFYARGLYHHWQKNYEIAVSNFNRYLINSPFETMVYWYRAECLVGLGRREDAIDSYQEYIRRENPRCSELLDQARQRIKELSSISP